MIQRLLDKKKRQDEGGFTLIELLVVIVILGILAAVVVFAVGGINDRGEVSACKIDTRTLQTSQEAYYAQEGTYAASEALLVTEGFLSEQSDLHEITGFVAPTPGPPPSPGSYDIEVTAEGEDSSCGLTGADVNTCGAAPGTPCADPTNI